MKIYHNNRCSKSRQCLALISDTEVTIIDYIKNPLSFDQLNVLIRKMDIQPEELIRKNEAQWKENYKDKVLSRNEFIQAMIDYPRLMERPIVETAKEARLCRPPELVLQMLKL
jgi:arsenate reductase (glutaredoxin)